jgi:hypothetical protein
LVFQDPNLERRIFAPYCQVSVGSDREGWHLTQEDVMSSQNETQKRRFVVVLRAQSAAMLRESEVIDLQQCPSSLGPINIRIRTRYVDEGFESSVPRHLWIEAEGNADTLDGALGAFASVANSILPFITLATNAAIHAPDIHLGFETTPGNREREFFQAFASEESGLPLFGRQIPVETLLRLIDVVFAHQERDRIQRAIGQFFAAATHWYLGHEIMALAHIYMGMESLTKVYVRKLCEERSITEEDLSRSLGVERRGLEACVRKTFLFQGDENCYRESKQASDGFEHGFLNFQEIHSLATTARDAAAKYLREAILNVATPKSNFDSICGGNYSEMLAAFHFVRYFRGKLQGDGAELAAIGEAYPCLSWTSRIKEYQRLPEGRVKLVPEETIRPRLAHGISFIPGSIEAWGPKLKSLGDVAMEIKHGEAELTPKSESPN